MANETHRLVVIVKVGGGEWEFTSEPLQEVWADILLRDFALQESPFVVVRAKKIPAKP